MKYPFDKLRTGVAGFFRFWYDFLVGDSIALAIGGIGVLLLGYALAEADLATGAQVLLPVAAIGTVWASLPRNLS